MIITRELWDAVFEMDYTNAIEVERHQMKEKGDLYDGYDLESYACPKCKVTISQQKYFGSKVIGDLAYKPKHCPDCGQRLLWNGSVESNIIDESRKS